MAGFSGGENWQKAALDRAPIGIFVVDQTGTCVYANKTFCRMTGYAHEDLTRLNAFEFLNSRDMTSLGDFSRLRDQLDSGPYEADVVASRRDGASLPVSLRMNRLDSETYIGYCEDMSAMVHLRQELDEGRRLQAIGRLAGGIAHDFNNILSPVIGYSDMVAEDLPADHWAQDYMGYILTGGKRARDLVQSFLMFSRQGDRVVGPVHIKAVVKAGIKLARAMLSEQNEIDERLFTDVSGLEAENYQTVADPAELQQVVIGLLVSYFSLEDNGHGCAPFTLQAVKNGEGDTLVDLPVTHGPHVVMTVGSDQVLTRETVQVMPSQMDMSPDVSAVGGGLGLAVVQGLIEGMGGGVTLQPMADGPMTLRVYLPLVDREGVETEVVSDRLRNGSEHILLVDDQPEIIRVWRKTLERLGYVVSDESSSIQALKRISESPRNFDLLVTDQSMPGMTGLELSQAVHVLVPELPILLISGYSGDLTREVAVSSGIREFLLKPLLGQELAGAVRRALDTKRAAGEA